MEKELEIKILMEDGCTASEAEKHLKNGSIVFDDFEEKIEDYLDEWEINEEDREEYRKMITDKTPATDWGIVEKDGETYYIEYVL